MFWRGNNGQNVEADMRLMAASQVGSSGGGSAGRQLRDWVGMERGSIGF